MEALRRIVTWLRPYRKHLAVVVLAALLGIGTGLVTVLATPPAADTVDRWPFPQWKPYQAGAKRAELAEAALWAGDPNRKALTAAPVVAGPPWRFIGVVREGSILKAVIELDQGKRIQRVGSGDPLPNGAKVMVINLGELTYMEENSEKTLRLFAADKSESSPSQNKVSPK